MVQGSELFGGVSGRLELSGAIFRNEKKMVVIISFRDQGGLGFRAQGAKFLLQKLGLRVWGFVFRI